MKYYAIIVAGGSGSRMQAAIPKQFLLLDNKPVLMHTLEAFSRSKMQPKLILVLNKLQQNYWLQLCNDYDFKIEHEIVDGGEERFFSVKNGLNAISGEAIVAIHDAVRPLICPNLISKSFEEAQLKGNCVVSITPTDSIRSVESGQGSKALNRNNFALIQTPQTFHTDLLRLAYQQQFNKLFTDDASVVEAAGFQINLIEGDRDNIKITWPEDFEIASILAKKRDHK